ncbi:hypothetical protein RCU58_20700, partial [Escherichia marmotae]|nr:hypothetical protein [Escherichia marmotae]
MYDASPAWIITLFVKLHGLTLISENIVTMKKDGIPKTIILSIGYLLIIIHEINDIKITTNANPV